MKMVHPGDADSKGVGWFQGSAFLGQTIIFPRILRPVIREHTQKHRCKLPMNSMFKWKRGDFCPVSLNYLVLCLVAQLCLTLCHPMNCKPARLLCNGDSPRKNTEVGCHALLQGIFPTQRSNPGLPHCRQILYHLSHQGILTSRLLCPWNSPGQNTGVGSHSFSRGSSQPRDWTQVSCIAGDFFIIWATREDLNYLKYSL